MPKPLSAICIASLVPRLCPQARFVSPHTRYKTQVHEAAIARPVRIYLHNRRAACRLVPSRSDSITEGRCGRKGGSVVNDNAARWHGGGEGTYEQLEDEFNP